MAEPEQVALLRIVGGDEPQRGLERRERAHGRILVGERGEEVGAATVALREQDVLLRGEVAEERAGGQVVGRGDLLDGHPIEPPLGEQPEG